MVYLHCETESGNDAPRIVLDTNIFIPSLLLRRSIARRVLDGELLLCLSPNVVREYHDKLEYIWHKFGRRVGSRLMPIQDASDIIDLIELECYGTDLYCAPCPTWYEPKLKDTDDRCFLWTAHQCGADYLVTYDHVLLERRRHIMCDICNVDGFMLHLRAIGA